MKPIINDWAIRLVTYETICGQFAPYGRKSLISNGARVILFLFFFVQLNTTNTISKHIEDNHAIPVSTAQQNSTTIIKEI